MNDRTAEAVERIVATAPPLPAEVAAMLRRDRCPIVARSEKAAA